MAGFTLTISLILAGLSAGLLIVALAHLLNIWKETRNVATQDQ